MIVPGTWADGELDALLEDVLIDAYGDGEQLGSFECVFADAGLPVAAEVSGWRARWMESSSTVMSDGGWSVSSLSMVGGIESACSTS